MSTGESKEHEGQSEHEHHGPSGKPSKSDIGSDIQGSERTGNPDHAGSGGSGGQGGGTGGGGGQGDLKGGALA